MVALKLAQLDQAIKYDKVDRKSTRRAATGPRERFTGSYAEPSDVIHGLDEPSDRARGGDRESSRAKAGKTKDSALSRRDRAALRANARAATYDEDDTLSPEVLRASMYTAASDSDQERDSGRSAAGRSMRSAAIAGQVQPRVHSLKFHT